MEEWSDIFSNSIQMYVISYQLLSRLLGISAAISGCHVFYISLVDLGVHTLWWAEICVSGLSFFFANKGGKARSLSPFPVSLSLNKKYICDVSDCWLHGWMGYKKKNGFSPNEQIQMNDVKSGR